MQQIGEGVSGFLRIMGELKFQVTLRLIFMMELFVNELDFVFPSEIFHGGGESMVWHEGQDWRGGLLNLN